MKRSDVADVESILDEAIRLLTPTPATVGGTGLIQLVILGHVAAGRNCRC